MKTALHYVQPIIDKLGSGGKREAARQDLCRGHDIRLGTRRQKHRLVRLARRNQLAQSFQKAHLAFVGRYLKAGRAELASSRQGGCLRRRGHDVILLQGEDARNKLSGVS